ILLGKSLSTPRLTLRETLVRKHDSDGRRTAFHTLFQTHHIAAQPHFLYPLGPGRFHGDLKLGLDARAVLQGDQRPLQREVPYHRFFLEFLAIRGHPAHASAELRFPPQRRARTGHVCLYRLTGSAQRDHHSLAGRKHGVELLARHLHTLAPRRMSPALALAVQLRRSELRVINEDVRISG